MSENSITLAIPAFNAEWCLPRLLRSAANQTTPFDEVLVYDDCSTDQTAAVAQEFGATVIRGISNIGCSAAKNELLKQTNSRWVHFHDADDELLPNFVELAKSWTHRADPPDVVLFDYEYRDNETGELISTTVFDEVQLKADPIRYAIIQQINPFCGLYKVDRLQAVGGYDLDPQILFNEDVAFHCKLALNGFTFDCQHSASIINYRVPNSMSQANSLRCLKSHHAVMEYMLRHTGSKYAREVADRLWYVSTGYAFFSEWQLMSKALHTAAEFYPSVPSGQGALFTGMCRILGFRNAFRLREVSIRYLKPHLRAHISRSGRKRVS